jgi:hypothetical protein
MSEIPGQSGHALPDFQQPVYGSGLARAFFTYAGLGRCCHVFGLLARFT